MSDPLRIHVIAEGETDKIVFDAFIAAVLGHSDFVTTLIQPETSLAFGNAGEHGGGWKGVQSKCMEIRQRGGLDASGVLANADLLLIHLDGEVAEEPEVQCARPCPPPEATADALRAQVGTWLGAPALAGQPVVVAIPMKETEAWVFAALRPKDRLLVSPGASKAAAPPCFECRDKPSSLLSGGAPRLIRSGKKHKVAYRSVQPALVDGWIHTRRLSQAARFEEELRAADAVRLVAGG